MIQVGGSGQVLGTLSVPTSSSTMTSTNSQLAAEALGWPSLKRSTMNDAVLPYQAPVFILWLGRNAGQVALIAPSACS